MKSLPVVQPVNMSRKRKRESEKCASVATASPTCFTNDAFSSTPKKLIARRRKQANVSYKEYSKAYFPPPCLEIKSIANIVEEAQRAARKQLDVTAHEPVQELPKNPYEVQRKPPKKKKRNTDFEDACFENPALNLELPEKQFNPYEVRRECSTTEAPLSHGKCFVNAALNLRGQDVPAARNPFEIQRCHMPAATIANAETAGVENLALEEAPVPTRLKIGLPFAPTVGCRINFKNMPLSELTPSKLLAEKLVFSPVPRPKRSLDSIGEENSTMDIGRELDCYQLELENSINEAKLRKNCADGSAVTEQEFTYKLEVVEQKVTFTQKLAEILEDEEEEKEAMDEQARENIQEIGQITQVELNINTAKSAVPNQMTALDAATKSLRDEEEVADVAYASDSEEEEDFKTPAPFVRAYRRDSVDKITVSKESLNSVQSSKSSDSVEQKKTLNVKNLIRKSIRKIMHPMHSSKDGDEAKTGKDPEKHTNIISTIRHSLRRKSARQLLVEDTWMEGQSVPVAEISIIDSSERTMKFKSNVPQAGYIQNEQLTNEKKHSLRHSIRESTREMRHQLMKSVFHKKHEEYAFCK